MALAHPGIRECLDAATRVRAAPLGYRAREIVRPRGVTWLFRDRPPLALLLYRAGLEGRVVWQDPGGFALLEPPWARPADWRAPSGGHLTLLCLLERYWGQVVFATPALLGLALAALLALVAPPWVPLTAVFGVAVYTISILTTMAIWQIFFGQPEERSSRALPDLAAEHWSMPIVHQERTDRIDELLDQVGRRMRRLVAESVRRSAADSGGQIGSVRLTARLVVPHNAATSDAVRERITAARAILEADHSVLLFDARPDDVPRTPAAPIAFFRFYVLAVVVVLLGLPVLVMTHERASCVTDRCEQGAVTYGRALSWLAHRVMWQHAAGIQPNSSATTGLGLLVVVLLPLIALVGVVAWRRRRDIGIQRRMIESIREKEVMGTARVLIVTVADIERDVVLDVLEAHTGTTARIDYSTAVPTFSLGTINDAELYVVQTGSQGSGGGAGALAVTGSAVRQIDPHYALIVGICYGLRPGEQVFGDILVSERIRDLDHGKLVEVDGRIEERLRGETVMPSAMLLKAVRAAARTWQRKSSVPVHVGLMLAWNKLINATPVVAELRERHPDAIGGDMEGAGFHAAARLGGVECLLIKGICDFAEGKTDEAQPRAARNAAEFVLHLVVDGALSTEPGLRRG